MPNEALINRIENVLSEITTLGGVQERTSIVTNLIVIDNAPSGLTNFIIVRDERDGNYITAQTVPGIVYTNGDLVNILFIEGTEPIAFQQGSQSASSNSLWQISTVNANDIYYNTGNVGVGTTGPDAQLDVLATTTQLRLTRTDGTVFVDFTVDTNSDLTITPSSTGQIILQPTTDSTDFFQVLDADGGTPTLNVDSTNERVGIGTATPDYELDVAGNAGFDEFLYHNDDTDTYVQYTDDQVDVFAGGINLLRLDETTQDVVSIGDVAGGGDVDINFNNGQMFVEGSSGDVGVATITPQANLEIEDNATANIILFKITADDNNPWAMIIGNDTYSATDSQGMAFFVNNDGTAHIRAGGSVSTIDLALNSAGGDVGIGIASPTARLHVDQSITDNAQPVLLLDQADVSEEFIRFIGMAAAATLTQSIVAEADVTTATRQGFTRIYVQDDGNQVTDQAYYQAFYTLA
jgi:hypothetical protein